MQQLTEQKVMKFHKGNIAIMAQIIALMTMVISFYVPHHHHEESICVGNYDCESSGHHHDDNDCGGKESNDVCCQDESYTDSRCSSNDDADLSIKIHKDIIDVVYELICLASDNKCQTIAFLPEPPFVAPVLSAKALRSPPAC